MVTRRTVLKASITAGMVTTFSGAVNGINALAQNKVRIRKTLTNMPLDSDDLETYRVFVGYMKKMNQKFRVSWLQYSLMHGKYTGEYRYCPHGDWYFLPWHRAYVLMYERAAQRLTGNADFAMPYWNWTDMRMMPEAFANPEYKGKPNPLFVRNRNTLEGQYALTDDLVGPQLFTLPTDPDYTNKSVYSETSYQVFGTSRNPRQNNLDMHWVVDGGGFQGKLESTPHNMVHNNIGVYMPTAGSPRDPIFMMHHSHIDGIWARWNSLGRKNTTDNLWLNMNFKDNFITAEGGYYSNVVNELQDIRQLGYTYDSMPKADSTIENKERAQNILALFSTGSDIQPTKRLQRFTTAKTLFGNADVALNANIAIGASNMTTAENGTSTEVFALIKGISLEHGINKVRVFVNHPDLALHIGVDNPHFVTTLGFLRHSAEDKKEKPSAIVNLTSAIQRLRELGLLSDDKITVQLLPVPKSGVLVEESGSVSAESIEIAIL